MTEFLWPRQNPRLQTGNDHNPNVWSDRPCFEEIDHVFQNETMVSVLPFHSNAFGGIRLKVHELDIERATQIIKNMDQASHLRIV